MAVYWRVTKEVIIPYYYEGLIFALTLVCFGLVSFLSYKSNINVSASIAITISLTVILSLIMLAALTFMAFDSATKVITDSSSYERVIKKPAFLTTCL